MRTRFPHISALLIALLAFPAASTAVEAATGSAATASVDTTAALPDYDIQPGDVLTVSVWKEDGLQAEVLVRPDGGISFPLVGDISAAGKTVQQLSALISERLKKYIPDPVVTVSTKALTGNTVYVIGKVNRPGELPITHYVDVMQALSMAGGATPFAALNDIKILRRIRGKQSAISFRYGDVESGKKLEQNIILKSGDIVVVP